jgi:curved DNA-binding protein CbpA
MTHYQRLGIPPDAPTEEVERAFRRCARLVHPDLNSGDPVGAEAQMKELNEIRDILTTPSLRAAYDEHLRAEVVQPRATAPSAPREEPPRRGGTRIFAAVAVGAASIALVSVWPRSKEPVHVPVPQLPVDETVAPVVPASAARRPRPANAPPRPTRARVHRRGTIGLGSTADEVFAAFGPPDRIDPGRQTGDATLHYGSLRLEMKNGRVTGGDAAK